MSRLTLQNYNGNQTPPTGKTIIYSKSDGLMYSKGADGIERALTSPGTVPANSILGVYRNRLINGGFNINQRGVSITATPNSWADKAYCMDRWFVHTESGSISIRQQFDPEATQSECITLLQPDLVAKRMGIAQIVESVNIRRLKGQNFTLSGRIRSSSAQAIKFAVLSNTGTADAVSHQLVNSWTSTNFSANNFFTTAAAGGGLAFGQITPVASTWTSFTLNGTFPAGLKNATVFIWTEAAFAQNNTLDIGMVQLESGSTASYFEDRYYGLELALCQRYYWSSFPIGTQPAYGVAAEAIVSTDNGTYNAGIGYWNSYGHNFKLTFPTQQRIAPSLAFYNSQSTSATQFYSNTYSAVNWSAVISNRSSASAQYTSSSGQNSGGATAYCHLVADSDI